MADSGSLSAMALTQTTILFVTLLPPVEDMRKASPNDVDFRHDVRTAEGVAAALSLATGLGAGLLAKSATPIYMGLASTALLIVLSELLLRQNTRMEGELP